MNKRLFYGLSILSALIVATAALVIFWPESEISTSTDTTTSKSTQNPEAAKSNIQISSAEVAKHDQASDCWAIIDGKVYDLTTEINSHPGGNVIEQACGQDATSLFNQRKTAGGETIGSGTPHSGKAQDQLQSLYKGELAQ